MEEAKPLSIVPPKAVAFFEYKDVSFVLRSSGYIECGECDFAKWCEHNEILTRERGDRRAIWTNTSDELPESLFLEIPMFPSENFWKKVRLKLDENMPRYAVHWRPPLHPDNAEAPLIMFLNPGEGRNVIRTVLVEYMLYSMKPDAECKAGHHGYIAQIAWENDMKTSRKTVQLWSVYTTDMCLTCLVNMNVTDPDLIPDRQGSGVWNRA